MNFTRKAFALGLLTMGVVGASVATVACSDDEVTPVPSPTVDAGSDAGPKADLYTRLGGDEGVDGALGAIITAELTDPAIASYFFAQVAMPHPAGTPTVSQLTKCFRHLIKRNTKEKTAAEPVNDFYGDPAKNDGWTCRDMKTAHLALHISGKDFDKFVSTATSTLTTLITSKGLSVSATEAMGMVNLLNGTKADVIDATRGPNDTGFPTAGDGGTDGGDGGH